MNGSVPAYGLWSLVAIDSLVFIFVFASRGTDGKRKAQAEPAKQR